jgi:hypothetical protein
MLSAERIGPVGSPFGQAVARDRRGALGEQQPHLAEAAAALGAGVDGVLDPRAALRGVDHRALDHHGGRPAVAHEQVAQRHAVGDEARLVEVHPGAKPQRALEFAAAVGAQAQVVAAAHAHVFDAHGLPLADLIRDPHLALAALAEGPRPAVDAHDLGPLHLHVVVPAGLIEAMDAQPVAVRRRLVEVRRRDPPPAPPPQESRPLRGPLGGLLRRDAGPKLVGRHGAHAAEVEVADARATGGEGRRAALRRDQREGEAQLITTPSRACR